jgi:hypothetical protein
MNCAMSASKSTDQPELSPILGGIHSLVNTSQTARYHEIVACCVRRFPGSRSDELLDHRGVSALCVASGGSQDSALSLAALQPRVIFPFFTTSTTDYITSLL